MVLGRGPVAGACCAAIVLFTAMPACSTRVRRFGQDGAGGDGGGTSASAGGGGSTASAGGGGSTGHQEGGGLRAERRQECR